MQKITPNLWFNDQAEEAANFYVSTFNDSPFPPLETSKIANISYYDEASAKASGQSAGSVLVVAFQLAGQELMLLNGGPQFKLTEAISLMVSCDSQAEVDYYWDTLSAGGQESVCGWLKDKYGLSWQVVPKILDELLQDQDKEKAGRVMQAMLQMKKIEIDGLKKAYEGNE